MRTTAIGPTRHSRTGSSDALCAGTPRSGWRPPGTRARSLQSVEAHRTAGHYLVLRLGGQWTEPLADHVRRAREEAVLMRVISRPHDLVRADIVGEHSNAVLDRLEREPAIALKELARPRLRSRFVKAVIVEMPVHAVEPRRDPAAARFEERDAQSRMAIDDAAPDTLLAPRLIFPPCGN